MPTGAPFPSRPTQFLERVRQVSDLQPRPSFPPVTQEEWKRWNENLRLKLKESFGGFPSMAQGLKVESKGTLERPDYRVEKLLIETFPGVWLTANAYVPRRPGKLPAVLGVHGHWKGAKQDPVVQSRCIGLAKLGFFVLAVDAFGAGERAIGKALGEYHGAMAGAALFPTGWTLAGIQLAENMRCVDYLRSRTEVNPDSIGVTGASGGGNQSMYVGAYDERIKCVVPVCSVGTYRAYLGAACCMCEVVPGALATTEEAGVLSLVAPRALMVINATRDAFQFSVDEAKKSLQVAQKVFDLHQVSGNLRHSIFESGHDYSRPMREAMYGWMALHLRGEGDGSPIPEPVFQPEEREDLRCFPGDSRPDSFLTLPKFVQREGAEAVLSARANRTEPIENRRQSFLGTILPAVPELVPLQQRLEPSPRAGFTRLWFVSEPGLETFAEIRRGASSKPWGLFCDLRGSAGVEDPLVNALENEGWNLAILNGRGTGELSPPGNQVHTALDHNTAEWNLWIGRTSFGGWVWDAIRLIQSLKVFGGADSKKIHLIGMESGALPIAGAAIALNAGIGKISPDEAQLKSLTLVRGLGTYVTNTPYERELLGIMVPGILRKVGDVSDLLGLAAPVPLTIIGARNPGGEVIQAGELDGVLSETIHEYSRSKAPDKLLIAGTIPDDQLIHRLSGVE